MTWPDAVPHEFPDAREHAVVILEAVDGDRQLAQESVMALAAAGEFTIGYTQRLLWLLTSHGEA